MGHFEKGAWVEDPFDRISMMTGIISDQLTAALSRWAEKTAEDLKHSGKFRRGRELTVLEVMVEPFENLASHLIRR